MGTKLPQADAGPGSSPEADDFKRIPGIGPVIERHLHEAGVRTFAQLAALNPDQLAGMVAHLPLLSTERIVRQDWVGRARDLAGEAVSLAAALGAPGAPGKRYATFTIELQLDAQSRVIRTRTVHLQDGAEETWDGWSVERLVTFFSAYAAHLDAVGIADPRGRARMLADSPGSPQAAMPGLAEPVVEQAAGEAPAGPAEVLLELGELVVELVLEDEPGAPQEGASLRARLPFTLAGPEAWQIVAAGAPYSVVILASDIASGAVTMVGALNGRLRPGQQSYGPIADLAPPREGRFQLFGAVLIVQSGLVKSALGPVLHVVA
ncbi:MAG: hypothetical protein HGA45_13550 [Chloroflexales bacterium]|nr:hypothetical protein [Chloroflexales bacterium]